MDLSLGIDFGTSGARAIVLNPEGEILAQVSVMASQGWDQMLWQLLHALPMSVRSSLSRIAVNGTSSTVLLCDRIGMPITAPLLYNHACETSVLEKIRAIAPAQHTVISATSSLAKLLWWQANCKDFSNARYL